MTAEVKLKIGALQQLGEYILGFDERLEAHMTRAMHHNPWFTMENQRHALEQIAREYLVAESLERWLGAYEVTKTSKTVGIIAAGNIPVVAFHDVLSAFVCGHRIQAKLSEKDKYLLPFLVRKLQEIMDGADPGIDFVEKLHDFDAVIATGSNNSARYFNQYFGKYPNIIRKNRNGIAVLSGEETDEELQSLADDVFTYFGLGCRNVSHIKVPAGYDLERLRAGFAKYAGITDHNKYKNNFDYNLAIFILNNDPHLNLENIILTPSESLISPVGCLYYSEYESEDEVLRDLADRPEEIQCVVSHRPIEGVDTILPGLAQKPSLTDYADGVDTMAFLTSLS